MPALASTKRQTNRKITEGEGDEYRRLLRAIDWGAGTFFLYAVESNFPEEQRNSLFLRLRNDLSEQGLFMRHIVFNREEWDIFTSPEMGSDVTEKDVILLTGLESVPGLFPEAGSLPKRSPAFDLLNQQREQLRCRIPAPFIVWIPSYAFDAFQEQAPDLFDQLAGVFRFQIDMKDTHVNRDYLDLSTKVIPDSRWDSSKSQTTEPAAVSLYRERVEKSLLDSPERGIMLARLAGALWNWNGPDYALRLNDAKQIAQEGLSHLSIEEYPAMWAEAKNTLGLIYSSLSSGDRAANIKRAIDCFEGALQVYTEHSFPREWAKVQNNLGTAFSVLPSGDPDVNLRYAIDNFIAALKIRIEIVFPQEWAMTQNNLGNAYNRLGSGERNENLNFAIECYKAALSVRSKSAFPLEWALTQNNLGVAYTNLSSGDRNENLLRAIECYEASLNIYKESLFPAQWAGMKNNLGNAYAELSTGDKSANLCSAIDCFHSSLSIIKQETEPKAWADTQLNLGLVLREAKRTLEAREAFLLSAKGFRAVGLHQEAIATDEQAKQCLNVALRSKEMTS